MSVSVTAGHATDRENRTGVTVIRFSEAVPTVADVRGGAPGTRETDLLQPGKLVQRANAFVLTGGSAFGLATADGVMRRLREEEIGFPTAAGPVPIVPAGVIFDLANGNPVPPTPEMGYLAAASAEPIAQAEWGSVGAGTGAQIDKLLGNPQPGGVGFATVEYGAASVTAIAVVNALGAVGLDASARATRQQALLERRARPAIGENTTLVAVLVDDDIAHDQLHQVAVSAHDGFATAITPSHTPYDGDLVFAASLRPNASHGPISLDCCVATQLAVERAILRAVNIR